MDNRELKLLTWNLAMMERSVGAPTAWGQLETEAIVRETILEVEPDIIHYQELPGIVPFVETHDMIRANPRTHSGNLATLLTHELMATEPSFKALAKTAILTTFDSLKITVANVHLAPGPAATEERLEQLSAIVDASPTDALVVAGDSNARVDEYEAIASLGLQTPKPPKPTWDGHRNNFRGKSGRFKAYFTQCFVTGNVELTHQKVHRDPVTLDGYEFFVSDHFALSATIRRR